MAGRRSGRDPDAPPIGPWRSAGEERIEFPAGADMASLPPAGTSPGWGRAAAWALAERLGTNGMALE